MEEEMKKELNNLKKQINDFEMKYLFSGNGKLVSAILDKLNIENLVLSFDEVDKRPTTLYQADYNYEENTVTIRRYKDV